MSFIAALAGTVTPGQDNLDPSKVSPGLLGAGVMFVLALATIILVRSMVWHLRKVRYSPEPGQEPGADSNGTSSASSPRSAG